MSELQGYWRLNANCNMEKYTRKDGHFYQTQTNAGNECSFFFIQSYNRWEAIPEHLSITLYGGIYRFFNFTDDYRHTYTAFNGGASVEAYLGKWTLTAYADNGWNLHSRDLGNMLTLNLTWHLSSGRKYRNIQRTMNHRDTETGILQSK